MKREDRQIPRLIGLGLIVLPCFAIHTVTFAQNTEHLAEKALAATVYLEQNLNFAIASNYLKTFLTCSNTESLC